MRQQPAATCIFDGMIDTPEALDSAVASALDAGSIAVDTEFVWERTYYPVLSLIQLGLPDGDVFVIDAVRTRDLSPLRRFLEDPATVKVLHDASHDLRILHRETGAVPQNIFDIQRAAGFIGLESTLSLQNLLKRLLEIQLAKTETRSDWLRRPLTDAQLNYAQDDVRHLVRAMQKIRAMARDQGREHWLAEEMAACADEANIAEPDPFEYYLRVGGMARLKGRQREILRYVAAWREEAARSRNLPRSHVLADKILLTVARRAPRTLNALSGIRQLGDRPRRMHGAAIVEAVSMAFATREEDLPAAPAAHPADRAHLARTALLEAYVTGKGLASGVDPALVATRSDISAFAVSKREKDQLLSRGWRWEFAGKELEALLQGSLSVRVDPATGLVGPA